MVIEVEKSKEIIGSALGEQGSLVMRGEDKGGVKETKVTEVEVEERGGWDSER